MKKRKFLGLIILLVVAVCSLTAVACDGAKMHTVTFTGEGISTFTQSVSDGNAAVEPKDPKRDGYTFDGWYLGDDKYDFSKPVTKDITLVAHWSGGSVTPGASKVTVTFKVEGVEYETKEVTKGEPVSRPDTDPKTDSKGGAFKGWYYGDTEWDFSNPVNGALTLNAKFGVNPNDVTALSEALYVMQLNYTASYYISGGLSYKLLATYDAVLYNYGELDKRTYGYKFKSGLAYRFKFNEFGVAEVEDTPYGDPENPLTQREVVYSYPVSVIYEDDFTHTEENEYTCKEELLAEISQALVGATDARSIVVTLAKGVISKIAVSGYTSPESGLKANLEIRFTDIGKTNADWDTTNADSIWALIPDDNNPDYPDDAPQYFGDDPVKTIDKYLLTDNCVSNNDNTLPDLKEAIDNARYGISYVFSDYYDDFWNQAKGNSYSPYSQNHKFEYNGYRFHYTRGYDDTKKVDLGDFIDYRDYYYMVSDSVPYRIVEGSDKIYYSKISVAYSELDNIFAKLSASMFEATATEGVYQVKSALLDEVSEIVYNYYARDPMVLTSTGGNGIYHDEKPDRLRVDYIRLTARNGNVMSLEAKRTIIFNSQVYQDSQYAYYTFYGYEPDIVMPNERKAEPYTEDQLELVAALEKTGSNYTMNLQWYDGYQRIDYYGDRMIYREYTAMSSNIDGFVYINDYAYYFCNKYPSGWDVDHIINKEPYSWGNQVYYRAYMEAAYLPLAKFNAHDFEKDSDGYFVLKKSAMKKYGDWEFDFRDEGGFSKLYIVVDDDGYVEQVVCETTNSYASGTAKSIAYFYDIGTTEYGKKK